MSQANVEVVRAIYRAYELGDYRAVFERMHDSGFARGHEGVRRSLGIWVGAWDDLQFELRELIDSGDQVLAAGWQRGRGKGSGVEVSEEIFSVWTLRAGKAVRQRMFRDRLQALEAAGLSV